MSKVLVFDIPVANGRREVGEKSPNHRHTDDTMTYFFTVNVGFHAERSRREVGRSVHTRLGLVSRCAGRPVGINFRPPDV